MLNQKSPAEHPNYTLVNRALASHFALASLYGSYSQRQDTAPLLRALRADVARHSMQLSLTGCAHFHDADLRALLAHLPSQLQVLRLDLGFTGLSCWGDFPVGCEALQKLQLRLAGPLRSASGVGELLGPGLRHVELWFSNMPQLDDIKLDFLGPLEELVLLVDGCPKVPSASKQALQLGNSLGSPLAPRCDAVKQVRRKNRGLRLWLHVEESSGDI